jgi:hypothetical protein
VLAQHPAYIAPIGAKSSFSVWFYRDVAPTALAPKIRGRLGDRLKLELRTVTGVQRGRRDISVESRGPGIQSHGGAAYSEHQYNVLLINVL